MNRHVGYVVSCLLILMTTISHEQSARNQIQLWRAGFMHPNEVKGKTGQKWYGLFETSSGFELRLVTITVLDSSNGLDDKYVDVHSDTLPVFLVRGVDHLQPRPINTVFFGNLHLDPDQYVVLDQREGRFYGLGASGKRDGEVLHNYQLTFYDNVIKQSIYKRNLAYAEGKLSLLWAGDIDGDGKLDLLLDLANHYNASEPTLFLSSAAGEGELVKRVASYVSIGC